MPVPTIFCALLLLLLSLTLPARAATTEAVFAAHQGAVVQVRLLDIQSGAQHSIGSGFHVGDGLIVTNYHVIADLLDKHGRYRAEARLFDDRQASLTLQAVDVVHDLALVHTPAPPAHVMAFAGREPAHGERLYSFGIPLDLGFTIVEGTHNGAIKGSLQKSIHFTGSLNPGMSGGPAVVQDGSVAGVNVGTSGDQVGYLIPGVYARTLVEHYRKAPAAKRGRSALMEDLRLQLLAHQDRVIASLLARPLPSVPLGPLRVPDTAVPWITCWGNSLREAKMLVQSTRRFCNTSENIFLTNTLTTGQISYSHSWINGKDLGRPRFLKLYADQFQRRFPKTEEENDELTGFNCQQDFFRKGDLVFRAALCLQGYKELPGLYDVSFSAASQQAGPHGLITNLQAEGLSLPNARRLIGAYIQSILPGTK